MNHLKYDECGNFMNHCQNSVPIQFACTNVLLHLTCDTSARIELKLWLYGRDKLVRKTVIIIRLMFVVARPRFHLSIWVCSFIFHFGLYSNSIMENADTLRTTIKLQARANFLKFLFMHQVYSVWSMANAWSAKDFRKRFRFCFMWVGGFPTN